MHRKLAPARQTPPNTPSTVCTRQFRVHAPACGLLEESREGHRDSCCHRIGSVHDLHMDMRFGGVAGVAARGKALPESQGGSPANTDGTALQVHQRYVTAPVHDLQHHVIAGEPDSTLPKPTPLAQQVGEERQLRVPCLVVGLIAMDVHQCPLGRRQDRRLKTHEPLGWLCGRHGPPVSPTALRPRASTGTRSRACVVAGVRGGHHIRAWLGTRRTGLFCTSERPASGRLSTTFSVTSITLAIRTTSVGCERLRTGAVCRSRRRASP